MDMRMKCCVAFILMIYVTDIFGQDENELWVNHNWFDPVSVTSTNLIIKFHPHNRVFITQKSTGRLSERNEELVLSQDRETELSDGRHVRTVFTPITFMSQQKGFKISLILYGAGYGLGQTNHVTYLALSDTPVKVGEDDVDMIMVSGEWKKFEKDGGAQVSPPSREAVQPVTQETQPDPTEIPDNVTEDEQNEEKNKANNFGLYALIPLFLCAGTLLWFIRKKR